MLIIPAGMENYQKIMLNPEKMKVPADILNRYLLIAENPIWPPMTTSTSCSPIIQIWHAVYHFQHFWGQEMQWKHLQSPQVNG